MKTKWTAMGLFCNVAIFVITAAGRYEAAGQATPKVPEGWTFTFPKGNPNVVVGSMVPQRTSFALLFHRTNGRGKMRQAIRGV